MKYFRKKEKFKLKKINLMKKKIWSFQIVKVIFVCLFVCFRKLNNKALFSLTIKFCIYLNLEIIPGVLILFFVNQQQNKHFNNHDVISYQKEKTWGKCLYLMMLTGKNFLLFNSLQTTDEKCDSSYRQ